MKPFAPVQCDVDGKGVVYVDTWEYIGWCITGINRIQQHAEKVVRYVIRAQCQISKDMDMPIVRHNAKRKNSVSDALNSI